MNSRARICWVALRMTTANRSQISRPSTQMTTVSDEPTMDTTASATSTTGIDSRVVTMKSDHHVDAAAEIAGEHAEHRADDAGDQHRGEADQQRNLRAVEQPRKVVAPELVGAERMRPGGLGAGVPDRRNELAGELLVVGIVRGDERRQQRHQHDDPEDGAADQQAPVAEDAAAQQRAGRRRQDLGGGRHAGSKERRFYHVTPP